MSDFKSVQDFSENFNVDEIDNSTPTGQHKQDEVRHILSVYFNNDMNQLVDFVTKNHSIQCVINAHGEIGYQGDLLRFDKSDIVFNEDGSINTDDYFENNEELLSALKDCYYDLDGYEDLHFEIDQQLILKDDALDNALQTPRL